MVVELTEVTLTTDGGCWPNPGPGAWAYILRCGESYKESVGVVIGTTNNRMEMQAIIEGLKALKRPCHVKVISDSNICTNLINGRGKKPSKRANQDLVRAIIDLMQIHAVYAEWIKGHNGNVDNERCDTLAMQAIRALPSSLKLNQFNS